jgi:4-diphosphocytidyl-2-C-methyl-D-erythritol kinase
MKLFPNCKINIGLRVVRKREDGYHDLETIFYPVYGLHDELEVEPSAEFAFVQDGLTVDCSPTDNLIYKTYSRMRERYPQISNVTITFKKNIPFGAGLGGGSSDAAAVMKAVVKLLNLKTTDEELFKIALQIGADVPYFLKNKPARVNGIGEFITPIKIKKKYDVLLVKPKQGCATKEVFKASDDTSWGRADIEKTIEYIEKDNLNELKNVINNDLEEAATNIVPEIKLLKDRLYNDGFEIVGMTGSGSTVFAFVTKPKLAKRKLAKYQEDYDFAEITSLYTNL